MKKKIVIAGGGTAGWMCAAALANVLPRHQYHIALVESPDISSVSVGEATIPNISNFLDLADISEQELLKSTFGTYKLGIAFENWGLESKSYMHPFGGLGVPIYGVHFFHYLLRGKCTLDDLPGFCVEWALARKNIFRKLDRPKTIYAYHLNAVAFASLLQRVSTSRGVEHIKQNILRVEYDPEIGISKLVLEDMFIENAHIYLDCTGFRGLLISGLETSGNFSDWSSYFPCNCAITLPSALSTHRPYTIATACSNGWRWDIPLTNRTGIGRVFSTGFDDEQSIMDQLTEFVRAPLADPGVLRWRSGVRSKTWIGNCIAIGLSSGFLEPLESTSIYLIQAAINRLINLLPGEVEPGAERVEFNTQTMREYEHIRDFLLAHYILSDPKKSEFWNYVCNMKIPDTLAHRLELFRASGRIFRRSDELFNEHSWFYVLFGQGVRPAQYHPLADALPMTGLRDIQSKIRKLIADKVS
ncbi:MAG: tryptophan 7-halogenase [Hyphomonadaceae bacterium]|nr:tryptophan 7-halogenase [Hyphomonadaceae bacterium]MBC6412826.1 tryptophan 7-halogenase [Hyphomonadaceae bacterium]